MCVFCADEKVDVFQQASGTLASMPSASGYTICRLREAADVEAAIAYAGGHVFCTDCITSYVASGNNHCPTSWHSSALGGNGFTWPGGERSRRAWAAGDGFAASLPLRIVRRESGHQWRQVLYSRAHGLTCPEETCVLYLFVLFRYIKFKNILIRPPRS